MDRVAKVAKKCPSHLPGYAQAKISHHCARRSDGGRGSPEEVTSDVERTGADERG